MYVLIVLLVILLIKLLVALLRNIPAPLVERQLHAETDVVFHGCDVEIGVQDLDVGVLLDVTGCDVARAGSLDQDLLRTVGMQFGGNSLHVQHDFGNVLLDAGNGRHFVKNAVDLDARDSDAGQRAQKHPAQRVAEGNSVASFQGLDDKLSVSSVIAQIYRNNVRLFDF